VRGLIALKLLRGSLDKAIASGGYKTYFPHKTGHWLGLDVHDVGDYHIEGSSRILEPGMVLTVEPGIYIAPDDANASRALRGQAVRIEDEVAITAFGPQLLTDAVARSVAAIEGFMQAAH